MTVEQFLALYGWWLAAAAAPAAVLVWAVVGLKDRAPRRSLGSEERRLRFILDRKQHYVARFLQDLQRFDRRRVPTASRFDAPTAETRARERVAKQGRRGWQRDRPRRMTTAEAKLRRQAFDMAVKKARAEAGDRLRVRFDEWDAEEDSRIDSNARDALTKLYPGWTDAEIQRVVDEAHRRPQDEPLSPRRHEEDEP